MKPHEDQSVSDYDVGSLTTSESKDTTQKPQFKDIEEDKERYASGKPKRIVIRARITHD